MSGGWLSCWVTGIIGYIINSTQKFKVGVRTEFGHFSKLSKHKSAWLDTWQQRLTTKAILILFKSINLLALVRRAWLSSDVLFHPLPLTLFRLYHYQTTRHICNLNSIKTLIKTSSKIISIDHVNSVWLMITPVDTDPELFQNWQWRKSPNCTFYK